MIATSVRPSVVRLSAVRAVVLSRSKTKQNRPIVTMRHFIEVPTADSVFWPHSDPTQTPLGRFLISNKNMFNKIMRSMTYLPRRARVPRLPNKFRHHL